MQICRVQVDSAQGDAPGGPGERSAGGHSVGWLRPLRLAVTSDVKINEKDNSSTKMFFTVSFFLKLMMS